MESVNTIFGVHEALLPCLDEVVFGTTWSYWRDDTMAEHSSHTQHNGRHSMYVSKWKVHNTVIMCRDYLVPAHPR